MSTRSSAKSQTQSASEAVARAKQSATAGEQASATTAENHEHAQAALQALVEQYRQTKAELIGDESSPT